MDINLKRNMTFDMKRTLK